MSTRRRPLMRAPAWKQARRERSAAAEELRLTVQHAPIGMALLDLDQRFVEANTTLCDMLGHSLVELEQRTLGDVTHPEDVGIDGELLAELLAGSRRHYEIVRRFVTIEGRIIEGTTSLSVARDASGDVTHFVAQIEDVAQAWSARQVVAGSVRVPDPRWPVLLIAASALDVVAAGPAATDDDRREQTVREALVQDRVALAYQPVFDLTSQLMVGVEALLRLTDEDGVVIAPYEALEVAERSGLIIDIGWRVLQLATSQGGAWRDQYGVIVPIAVNVSAAQLGSSDFPAGVLAAVARAGLPPHALTLELTETVVLGSRSAGSDELRELRAAGLELAIDDFGTGYASLSYLHELPVSTLKIDQTFVAGLPEDQRAVAIVAGVVALANNFGISCIAEGIETEAQRAHLAGLGVLGQGYLLGRPGAATAIGALIEQGRTDLPVDGASSEGAESATIDALGDARCVVA